MTGLLFFASVLAHELGHWLVSLRRGVPVQRLTLFPFGGLVQSHREPADPRGDFAIAMGGLGASAVLGVMLRILSLTLPDPEHPAVVVTAWLGRANLLLAAFNLAPEFPLDGGQILRALLWEWTGSVPRATRTAVLAGQGVAYAFILVGIGVFFVGLSGLWLVCLGGFLSQAALGMSQRLPLRQQLAGISARAAMTSDCPSVPRSRSLWDLVHNCMLVSGRRRVMHPLSTLHHAAPDEELAAVMERMVQEDINHVLVLDEGRFMGMVSRDGVLAYLTDHRDLEHKAVGNHSLSTRLITVSAQQIARVTSLIGWK
jgi:Zn-dependent protease